MFLLANTTSEALQSSDIDLAAASVAIENLSNAVNKMRNTDSEFDRVYGSAREQCHKLAIDCVGKRKRKRAVPPQLQNCVMDSFLTESSDAVVGLAHSPDDQTKQAQKLDFYIPVLDTVSAALNSRFSLSSTTVIKFIPSVLNLSEKFEKDVTSLCRVARLDAELCVVQGKLLLENEQYKAPNNPTSPQSLASRMVALKHNLVYREYYLLIVYLLTLPVRPYICCLRARTEQSRPGEDGSAS